LFSTAKLKLKELSRRTDAIGKIANTFLCQPDRVLSSILISNTLVNVFFTSTLTIVLLATLPLVREASEAVAAVTAFVLLLIFGEIGPKTLASMRPLNTLSLTSPPLHAVVWVLSPVSAALSWSRNILCRFFPEETESCPVTQENLINTAVGMGEETGALPKTTGAAIRRIFAADDTPVRMVMTPRARIYAVSDRDNLSDVAEIMVRTGLSRLPLFNENLDNLIGLVHLKDLLPILNTDVSLEDIARPIHAAKATDPVTKVLSELRRQRLHMSAVYNSQKRVIGLCTVEDLVEEIVGEIVDEHDTPHCAAGGSL